MCGPCVLWSLDSHGFPPGSVVVHTYTLLQEVVENKAPDPSPGCAVAPVGSYPALTSVVVCRRPSTTPVPSCSGVFQRRWLLWSWSGTRGFSQSRCSVGRWSHSQSVYVRLLFISVFIVEDMCPLLYSLYIHTYRVSIYLSHI